jgi:hypothetical protein
MHKLQFPDLKNIHIHELTNLTLKNQLVLNFVLKDDFNLLMNLWDEEVRTFMFEKGTLLLNLRIDFKEFRFIASNFEDHIVGSVINGD